MGILKEIPFELVRLSTLPESEWVGKTVLHPFEQTGKTPTWHDDETGELLFDLGIVFGVTPDPDFNAYGNMRCTFFCDNGSCLFYSPENLWVPVISKSGR